MRSDRERGLGSYHSLATPVQTVGRFRSITDSRSHSSGRLQFAGIARFYGSGASCIMVYLNDRYSCAGGPATTFHFPIVQLRALPTEPIQLAIQ